MFIPLCLALLLVQGEQPPPPPAVTHKVEQPYHIPYRLADTQHILVRAKINGKGPYTFIMDTGAPELFFARDTAQKMGITADKNSEATLNRVEIEGGAVVEKLKARIADPSQLVGMNALGVADTRIEGVLGYNVLARFRIELDLTHSKMLWTRLDYTPPAIDADMQAGGKPLTPSANYQAMENMNKMVGAMFPKKGETQTLTRGFFGIEFDAGGEQLRIKAVLHGSPAASAGLKPGDLLTQAALEGKEGQKLQTASDATRLLADVAPGESVTFTVQRGDQTLKIAVKAGKGGL
ncbi:MAG TPA: PDZ domain-containing protein [Chthonomonadaceae bacterium]|nr:PDZ domain-containing protein [Chthonomonadaceae bacterium]